MMEITKVKPRVRKEYQKVVKKKEIKNNELLQFDVTELGKIACNRYKDRKRLDAGVAFTRRKNVSQVEFRKIIRSYICYALEELIDKGEVYILSKRLYIERVISKRNLEWDKKWNGNQYIVFCDTITKYRKKIKAKKLRFDIGTQYIEKIYLKVKDNWNYYEQQFHFRNS